MGLETCWNRPTNRCRSRRPASSRSGGALEQEHVADEVEDGGIRGRVPPFRLRHGAADHLPVALRDVALADVGAVDGKSGQNPPQRGPQRIEREIAASGGAARKCG